MPHDGSQSHCKAVLPAWWLPLARLVRQQGRIGGLAAAWFGWLLLGLQW
jgi:hypothetical protein